MPPRGGPGDGQARAAAERPRRRLGGWLVPVVGTGLLLTAVTAPVIGPRQAGFVLAGVLALLALVRALGPAAAAAPFVVRSRWLDASSAALAATLIAVLCVIAPGE